MKNKISIKYFYNFAEDKRLSMQTVGNYLFDNFKNHKIFKVSRFIPKYFNKNQNILAHSWNLRLNRYLYYPNQVKNQKKVDIAHIIDHQYAHLVKKIKSTKKIITVHDLIPFIYSEKIGKYPYLVKYSLNHLKLFDKVIAVSENTKKDILKFTNCPYKKIVVFKTSVENTFNTKKIDKKKLCIKYNLPTNTKKVLIVGSSFYKNHQTSLKIFKNLLDRYGDDINLIKIGNKFNFEIDKRIRKNLFEITNLKRENVNEIYKISDLLLFPSIYEGYGLPCVEALNSGLPVVASNILTNKEILGEYPLLIKTNNINNITKKIIKLLENKIYYKEIKQLVTIKSKQFNEKNYFKKLEELYLNILNN